jgi:hypothetical protein
MPAKFDMTVGVELFKETFKRDPAPLERLVIAQSEVCVLAVASFDPDMRYNDLWKRLVEDKIEADWQKFADAYGMAGCMDSGVI